MAIQVDKHWLDDQLVRVIREAGAVLAEMQKSELKSIRKDDGSVTTNADIEAQRILVQYFYDRYPDVPLLVEEERVLEVKQALEDEFPGVRLIAAGDSVADLPATCVSIDPADGTAFLKNGSPDFGVSVAVLEGGQPIAGVIHQPAYGTILAFPSDKYEPEHIGGREKPLRDSLIGLDNCAAVDRGFRAQVINPLIDACCYPENLAAVASGIHLLQGITGAWVSDNVRNWDVAATALLVTKAGGCTWQLVEKAGGWELAPISWNVVKMPPLLFAANQTISNEILGIINSARARG